MGNFKLALWYRGVRVSHLIANQAYRNVVRVRITAIPFWGNSLMVEHKNLTLEV